MGVTVTAGRCTGIWLAPTLVDIGLLNESTLRAPRERSNQDVSASRKFSQQPEMQLAFCSERERALKREKGTEDAMKGGRGSFNSVVQCDPF